ncbi:MAG: DUF86 domain-containing protein [Clostridiales bacterium]|nr:DUF86 domain-containing protein [Clostridiales bacterium]
MDNLKDATLFHMIQMSESVRKLSEEFRKVHAEFPWNEIYGMRNRIVHDYGSVDLNIVFDTVKNDIPELLTRLTQL